MSLSEEIIAFIGGPSHQDETEFARLALALFARQYERCAPIRRYCDSLGVTPETVTGWPEIPAVPAEAFKRFDLSCAPLDDAVAVFHSSGTTGALASRHYMDRDALGIYEHSLRVGFARAIPETAGMPIWALMPPPDTAPNSSLTHMLAALGAERFFWDDDRALADALAACREPVLVFGTAFAWLGLFDSTSESWSLPAGSIVVETGGFKGRIREVARGELYALFETRLGVPLARCHGEYGMSEMASQFYGRGGDPVKRGPRWARARAINPETGDDARAGASGLLRYVDLANWNSVLAIQTADRGVVTADSGVELLGRAPDSEARGCSLTVEELWTSR